MAMATELLIGWIFTVQRLLFMMGCT